MPVRIGGKNIRCSQTLVGAIVAPATPKLEYLEISNCNNVEFLTISAINLLTFKYIGPSARLSYINVPNLADGSDRFDDFPELNNIKQLELVLRGWDKRGGLHYATLVKKCRMLYRLCAQCSVCKYSQVIAEATRDYSPTRFLKLNKVKVCLICRLLHHSKYSGFTGLRYHLQSMDLVRHHIYYGSSNSYCDVTIEVQKRISLSRNKPA
ncbi:hypothetical protein LguiA_021746 [Lonicera macranthoides]